MKTTNALVTYTDLTTMGLVAKGTPATGNRIATVSFINSNYYVNQSASPYNTYTSLRCPPYQTIIAGPTNSGTLYYLSTVGGSFTGFNTRGAACAHTTGGSVTVYWSGAFGNGTVLYLDADGISQFDGGGYFSLGGYSFQTDVATVYDYLICAAPFYKYSSANATDACNSGIPMSGVSLLGGGDICSASGIQCNEFNMEISGATVWVSYSSSVREATIDDPNVSGVATFISSCASCA
jgi:hypothetical protein